MVHDPSVRMSSSQAILSPELKVTEIDPWKDPRWVGYVLRHPEATVYHHPAWLAALQREYRQTGLFLACEDGDGTLQGVFPLLYTRGIPLSRGPLTGPRLSSLPRTPLAGPLATDATALEALLSEAVRRASTSHYRLQVKTQGEGLAAGVDGIVRKAWRLSYVVSLAGQPGQPYHIPGSQNRSSIKRAINKAIAGGVRVRPAESEDELRTWYRMYLETMRRNFVPARPYRFFLALWELMRAEGMMRLLIAEHQDGIGHAHDWRSFISDFREYA